MSDKIVSPEIVKLMDKMTQNPTSRLFVPLAEEYLKCQMVDEAVIVLVEGIKNHPTYVAARVMLGKIYLQKNQIPEAQAEFEQVIAINPENILAHKKLAMVYQGQGQTQKALEACKKVLMIDPSDKEAKGLVGVLEMAAASNAPSEAEVPSNRSVATEPSPANEIDMQGGDPAAAVEPAPAFEEMAAEVSSQPAPIEEAPMPVESAVPNEEISFEFQESQESPSQTELDAPGGSDHPGEPMSGESAPEAPIETPVSAEEKGAAPDDSWEGDKTVVAGFTIPSSEKEPVSSDIEEPSDQQEGSKEDPLLSTTLASLYMSQGHYQEAANVYQKLLARDPSDEESRQGLEKALHFLTSKQGTEKASQDDSGLDDSKKKKAQRLQSWLDSIRKKNES